MLNFFNLALSSLLFFSTVSLATDKDKGQTLEGRPIQELGPVRTYNPELSGNVRVKPSINRKLKAGERLDVPYVTSTGVWTIQRLTERSYWVLVDQFAVTVFVGNKGTLVIDAPDVFDMVGFVEQVRKITPLPITTVVYSHPHVDHVGNSKKLSQVLKQENINLRIIASENAAREIKRYKNSILMPTEVITNGYSHFQFEDFTFKYVTPVDWAHTGADSYIVTPDGVLHVVDFFYPGRLPMADVSGAQNLTGWIEMCRRVAGDPDWQFASLGHANIAYREDVLMTLDYFKDLYTHAFDVFKGFRGEDFVHFAGQNTGVMIRNMFDGGAAQLAGMVAEKWSHLPQWEVARDHAEKVLWDVALNYNYHERTLPDFEAISPPR